jgi:hypothetical protein
VAEDRAAQAAERFVLGRPWRVGRKVGRTVYCQLGTDASDADPLIGVMDTVVFAVHIVDLHNRSLGGVREPRVPEPPVGALEAER